MFSSAGGSSSFLTLILVYGVLIGGMYLLLFRPQQKKKKEEEQMRTNLQIGDEITTIGGIVGRVVSIKEDSDSIVVETGVDRSKIRLRRWAVASCDTQKNSAEK